MKITRDYKIIIQLNTVFLHIKKQSRQLDPGVDPNKSTGVHLDI